MTNLIKQIFYCSTLSTLIVAIVSCSNESPNRLGGKSIKVSDVKLAEEPLVEWDSKRAVQMLLQSQVEAYGSNNENLIPIQKSGFIYAAHRAFQDHRPLVISPDVIWYTICQGVSNHINHNPEKFRDKLVKFDGKKEISIRRDNFVKGSSSNDWPSAFPEFVKKIEDISHSTLPKFMNTEFTTTGQLERISRQVCTMDAYKNFLSYHTYTLCGIPEIILEGTTEDWQSMLNKIDQLEEFELGWWIKSLKPILTKFVESSQGKIDQQFWKSLYKFMSMSGEDRLTGWIIMLYPYLSSRGTTFYVNPYITLPPQKMEKLLKGEEVCIEQVEPVVSLLGDEVPGEFETVSLPEGLAYSSLPNSYVRVPFKWIFFHTSYDMYFYAGIMGLSQDKTTMAIRPEFAWAVGERSLTDNRTLIFGTDESPMPQKAELLKQIKGHPNARRILLVGAELNDQDLSILQKHSFLNQLYIVDSQLTGEYLKFLKNTTSLELLDLSKNALNPKYFHHLKHLKALEYLRLSNTGLDYKAIESVIKMTEVNTIKISRDMLTNSEAQRLIDTYDVTITYEKNNRSSK